MYKYYVFSALFLLSACGSNHDVISNLLPALKADLSEKDIISQSHENNKINKEQILALIKNHVNNISKSNSNNNSDNILNPSDSIFKIYGKNDIKRTFKDVAGLDEPKEALKSIIDYLKEPKAFTRLGAEPPTGVIFYGPPGTGKTEIARALAGEVSKTRDMAFIVASGASFENKYLGVGADNVRKLFALARQNRPAIIFIDEFDAVARRRDEEQKNIQVVNQLLTELDGFSQEDRADIFVIAATNLLEKLDAAVIRPGRFDRKIEIGLPNEKAQKAIIEHYFIHPKHNITGIALQPLINATEGWSTAELKTLVNEARSVATARKVAKVEDRDFRTAIATITKSRSNGRH
jgi:cell division protease FtsH